MEVTGLPFRQQLFILFVGSFILVAVIELIRKRRLIEKYAAMWIVLGIMSVLMIWLYPLIFRLTVFIGAGSTSSTILFFGIFILLMIIMQLCIKISDYEFRFKDLIQEVTIMSYELEQLKSERQKDDSEGKPKTESNQLLK